MLTKTSTGANCEGSPSRSYLQDEIIYEVGVAEAKSNNKNRER